VLCKSPQASDIPQQVLLRTQPQRQRNCRRDGTLPLLRNVAELNHEVIETVIGAAKEEDRKLASALQEYYIANCRLPIIDWWS
jgi:hypothetical protein